MQDGEGQNGNVDRSWIPEDLRTLPSLEKFKEPGAVVKSYVELEKRVGKLAMPKDDAAPEAWDAYYSERRPKSPDEYGLKAPEGSDERFVKLFAAKAHEAGLDRRQATAVFKSLHEDIQKALVESFTADIDKGYEELVKGWGSEAEKRNGAAARAMESLGLTNRLKELHLDHDPVLVKALSEVGMQMGEDRSPAGSGAGGADAIGSVRNEIRKLQTSPEYQSQDWATRQAAIRKMGELTRREIELEKAGMKS